MQRLLVLMIISIGAFCGANEPFLVNISVLNMHEECSETSSYVSQAIYGHTVKVFKKKRMDGLLLKRRIFIKGLPS